MILQSNIQEVTETLVDGESTEKTLSIIELISSGGTAGMVIIAILFVLLVIATYIYFERLFAIKAASKVDSNFCLLYTSPSPRDRQKSRMPSSA